MIVAGLIEDALEEAGIAVAVILHPRLGAAALIGHSNRPFSRIMGQPRPLLEGKTIGELRALVVDKGSWSMLLEALKAGAPMQMDLPVRVGVDDQWLAVQLTFQGRPPNSSHAILTARDITGTRRVAAMEDHSLRLLAAIFSKIDVAVVLVTGNGEIMMANPAMHHLLGYSADELKGLDVQDLTAAESAEAAQTARAKQLRDGERYDMQIDTVDKMGRHIPVRLTSVLLRDGDQRLRVVTLIPETPHDTSPAHATLAVSRVGELRAVSLAAFRSACGPDWERLATRAMMLAEQIIRHRLRPDDVVSRSDGHSFVIWFHSADEDRNAAILTAMVREIRLRFLTEFGEEVAAHVSATMTAPTMVLPKPSRSTREPLPLIQHARDWQE